MSFKIKQDAKVMLTALIAGGSLSTAVMNPAVVEATQESSVNYNNIITDDMNFDDKELEYIENDVSETDVIMARNSLQDQPLKEMGLTLFTDDATAINDYKEKNPITIDLKDDILLNITGKVVHDNKIYYRAEMSQKDASYLIDDYLELKDYFNAEGQEGLNLDYDLIDRQSDIIYEEEDYIVIEEDENNEEESVNNNFVFYVEGINVKKDISMNTLDDTKEVFAMNNTPILSEESSDTPIAFVEEGDKVEVIGENDNWYFVELSKYTLPDDPINNTDAVYGFVDRRYFSNDEIFIEEFKKLKAKRKAYLYHEPINSEDSISEYYVNEGGLITQLDKSHSWARIKLSSGEELYAKLEDFSDNVSNSENTVYIEEDEEEKEMKITKRIKRVRSSIPQEEIERRLSQGESIGEQIANFGLQFVGGRYVWGGNSLEHGVDCSGFTREVYKRFGINLPRYSGDQAKVGTPVSLEEARPGDLVCYDGHVGLYIGNGKMVHASNPRRGIIVTDVYFSGKFHSIRRIVN